MTAGAILVIGFLGVVAVSLFLFFIAPSILVTILVWVNGWIADANNAIVVMSADKQMGKGWKAVLFGEKKKK